MVPKDKGWGMSNLGYGGKTHVFPPCAFATFPCLIQPLQCLCFVSWGSYCMRKCEHGEASVLAGCCQFGRYACPVENLHFSHAGLHSPMVCSSSRRVVVCSSSRGGKVCSSSCTSRKLLILTQRSVLSSSRTGLGFPLWFFSCSELGEQPRGMNFCCVCGLLLI